jgi:hypothetical protein
LLGGVAMPVVALWLKARYAAKPNAYVTELVTGAWTRVPVLELPFGTARSTTLVAAVTLSSTFLLNYFLPSAVGG